MNRHNKDTKRKIPSELVNERGFPKPLEYKCFQCGSPVLVKYVIPKKKYSSKNDWEYYTGEKGKGKICDSCLLKLYYNKELFWETIKDLKKRNKLRGYIWLKVVKQS